MEILHDLDLQDLQDLPVKQIKRGQELNTIEDYRKVMASVTKRDIKVICILTSHWTLDWYRDMHGDIKWERDKSKHPIIVNSWIKRCKLT